MPNIAAKIAKNKQQHPEKYCPHTNCLWRLQGKSTHCPRHGVKVMRDMRNGQLDYYISLAEAKQKETKGEIFWELTNHCYCEN